MDLSSLLFSSMVAIAAAGTALLFGGKGALSRAVRGMRGNLLFLSLMASAVLANFALNRFILAPSPILFDQGTEWSESLLQALQTALPSEVAVATFSFIYLAVFPALLIAVPLALLARGEYRDLRVYCLAIAISYAGLIIFHLLILSHRPGLTPGSGVIPLMYNDPVWGNLSSDLGSRGNSFPSGHTTAVTAMVVALIHRRHARLLLVIILLFLITGVMYLGLHWPLDVAGGLILGAMAGWTARLLISRYDGLSKRPAYLNENPDGESIDTEEPRI